MRLTKITFTAICSDGLVEISGHAFEVMGRKLVVHKERPALLVIDKNYKVSEATVGFRIPIQGTTVRAEAVRFGTEAVSAITEESWQEFIRHAEEFRKSLGIVRG